MKKILLLASFIFTALIANAQFKLLGEGPVFEEPEEGYAKLLQMKNGNTMFIHITPKKGINVRLYNAKHEEIAVSNIIPSFGKKTENIEAAFEIGGDGILMINQQESRVPTLFRLVIDGKSGILKEEKKIGELNKDTFFKGTIVFNEFPPEFYIRKDPVSDNYAVVMFNGYESEKSKRIEIVAYGSNNQEISRAYYASPDEKFKFLQYVDMAVIGADKVCVLVYAYNKYHGKGKESELVLADLDKGAKEVGFTELGFSKDFIVYKGITRFSPATRSIILAAIVKQKNRDKGYTPLLAFVNPYERKINRADVMSPSERINSFSKGGFTGLPQNLFINNDGTFTVVSEEMEILSSSNFVRTTLGDLAIVNYSKTGEFSNDHIIRKNQQLDGASLNSFYHSEREGTAQLLKDGNQFKSFAYLNGINKSYLLFNDTKRNNDKQEKGGLVAVNDASVSDGFYYNITGLDVVPKRDYVFVDPESKRDHNLALFSISDYDKQTNTYVTLKLENKHGKKGVKVVWLQPQ